MNQNFRESPKPAPSRWALWIFLRGNCVEMSQESAPRLVRAPQDLAMAMSPVAAGFLAVLLHCWNFRALAVENRL
jgi:hypothetical protein